MQCTPNGVPIVSSYPAKPLVWVFFRYLCLEGVWGKLRERNLYDAKKKLYEKEGFVRMWYRHGDKDVRPQPEQDTTRLSQRLREIDEELSQPSIGKF